MAKTQIFLVAILTHSIISNIHLSGLNWSGSSQYCGSLFITVIGTMMHIPLGIVNPLTVVVSTQRRSKLQL